MLRRHWVLAAVMVLPLGSTPSRCGEPPWTDVTTSSVHFDSFSDRPNRAGAWARFMWNDGRLVLDAPRHRTGRQSHHRGDVTEELSVRASAGIPSLHYHFQGPELRYRLDVTESENLRIRFEHLRSGGTATLEQSKGKPISWTRRLDGQSQEFSADTWIHLYAADAAGLRQTILPLVDRLLPEQTVARLSDRIDRRWRTMSGAWSWTEPPAQAPHGASEELDSLIRSLTSNRRADRELARRRLLKIGTPVLDHLASADRSRWDAQQRASIESIERMLSSSGQDSLDQWTVRLLPDDRYWTAKFSTSERLMLHPRLASHLAKRGFEVSPGPASAPQMRFANRQTE